MATPRNTAINNDDYYRQLSSAYFTLGCTLNDNSEREKLTTFQKAGEALASIQNRNANDQQNLEMIKNIIEKIKCGTPPTPHANSSHILFSARIQVQARIQNEQAPENPSTYRQGLT